MAAKHTPQPGGLRHPISKKPLCSTCQRPLDIVSLAAPSIRQPAVWRHGR